MNIILITISLFLRIFARPVFAEDKSVVINIFSPNQIISVGQTFPIEVAVGTEIPGTFYYLFYGGPNDENSYIQTIGKDGSVLSINDKSLNWDLLPTFTTDELGNGYLRANNAFINSDKPSGYYSVYVKFFYPDHSTAEELISDTRQIRVISYFSPTPTFTPVPTLIPTSISTLKPTSTPTSIPHNQTPTLTPIPTINMSIFGTRAASTTLTTPESTASFDLINQDSSLPSIKTGSNPVEIKKTKTTKNSNTIPFVILGSGIVFSAIPLILLKINKK